MLKSTAATGTPVAGTGLTRDRAWRTGHLGPTLLFIGSIFWLIGSALLSGSQKRFASVITSTPTGPGLSSGVVFDSPYIAGIILWIIGSICWIFASLIMLSSAFAQAVLVTVSGVRPGIAKLSIVSAFIQLTATILILIGAAILAGESINTAGSGSIVMLIGFTLFGISLLFNFAVSFIVSTAVAIMSTPYQKQYTWGSTTSLIVLLVSVILFMVGTIAMVVRDPPGFFYIGAIVHLIASTYFAFGSYLLMKEAYGNFTPILSFITAVPMATTAGAVAGAAATKGGITGTGTGSTFTGTNPMVQGTSVL